MREPNKKPERPTGQTGGFGGLILPTSQPKPLCGFGEGVRGSQREVRVSPAIDPDNVRIGQIKRMRFLLSIRLESIGGWLLTGWRAAEHFAPKGLRPANPFASTPGHASSETDYQSEDP